MAKESSAWRGYLTIASIAVASRVATVIWTALAHHFISDYDTATELMFGEHPPSAGIAGRLLDTFVLPLVRWDALFFLSIASDGYLYEHHHAFFPGLPLLMRTLSLPLLPSSTTSARRLIAVVGVILSNGCFVSAAVGLLHLARQLANDGRTAFFAAALFCLPASSVFMSSLYTESAFCCCAFWGLALLYRRRVTGSSTWLGVLLLSAAASLRSNGVLMLIPLLFFNVRTSPPVVPMCRGWDWRPLICFIGHWLRASLHAFIIVLPTALTLVYGFSVHCRGCAFQQDSWQSFVLRRADDISGMIFPSSVHGHGHHYHCRPWCVQVVPSIYGFVQRQYWGVGPFLYFQLKQLPNFLLALPCLLMVTWAQGDTWKRTIAAAAGNGHHSTTVDWRLVGEAVQLAVLATFTVTCANVQVLTRLVSSSPLLWLHQGRLLADSDVTMGRRGKWMASVWVGWSCVYFFVGPLMFGNFLPWT
ncbi:unnamed protein product [Vitrella brassicaformis CCMP3155]|uniref:GPI mannosyltransferase 2 n=1 Tax=Vitrella brassicaformis (strain CCMP3155) TaxID=1169540 RepID=A0A0G4GZJ2_VITBC|nr:unnamed protein product [Vitrella brassicaformis CCMP3155]|eukprot:CEM36574.1 unnamed protein product [Vitrella brassicaformis CCMP3155]